METKELNEVRTNLIEVRDKLVDFNNQEETPINKVERESATKAIRLISKLIDDDKFYQSNPAMIREVMVQVMKHMFELFV